MEPDWGIYLRENAPELYEAMLGDVKHSAKWRDERIAELELERDTVRQMMDAAGKHLAEAARERDTLLEALRLPDVREAFRKVFLSSPQLQQRILARTVLEVTEPSGDGCTPSERVFDGSEEGGDDA